MAHTPTPWKVRRLERDGELRDCIVAAPDVNGFPYDAEILGDDEYREQSGGIDRRVADCELIVRAVNSHEALLEACKRLLEELRLIRMKDSGAVYDVTCRIDAAHAIKAAEASA